MDGELTIQSLNLEEAACGLGLGGLGVRAFPILGAIIPNSDWGTAFSGVGPVAAMDIMAELQDLAYPPKGSGTSLTPELVRRDAVAEPQMTLLFERNCQRSRRICDSLQALVASMPSQLHPVFHSASCVLPPLQIFSTALRHDNVDIHQSQPDEAAARQTLAQTLMIFARGPVVKVDNISDATPKPLL